MSYEDMLNSGIEQLPEQAKTTERFHIPKVKGHLEGNKTVVANFKEIAQTLRRPEDHLIKFLLKELAAPGDARGANFIIGRRVSSQQINEKINKYANTFVICPACGKPDTKLTKENNLICQACGTKTVIRA